MVFDINTVVREAKEKAWELISVPVKFWFGLPVIVHLIFYGLLIWFACYIAYIIYANRTEIFHKT